MEGIVIYGIDYTTGNPLPIQLDANGVIQVG
jgi:hypothetical protein